MMGNINVWDMPKEVTVYYLDKDRYEPTIHKHITRLHHDDSVWYLFAKDHVTAQIKFDEVLRIEFILEDVDLYPKDETS